MCSIIVSTMNIIRKLSHNSEVTHYLYTVHSVVPIDVGHMVGHDGIIGDNIQSVLGIHL